MTDIPAYMIPVGRPASVPIPTVIVNLDRLKEAYIRNVKEQLRGITDRGLLARFSNEAQVLSSELYTPSGGRRTKSRKTRRHRKTKRHSRRR